ncbi:carboxypeptidase-like regulatory domain-containing protein [Natronomonas sp. EA1]|uniref:carboxypeptidase-like regulatory domain-containing protein n=1 Tax=Natronomonas sp. EA1 TaxID=3421655 RepID=UPI003EBABF3C
MRPAPILVVLLLLVAGVGPVTAQESPVTLTVSVVDQQGSAVGNAEITASWSDGETTATTASNGKAFVDVPEGADVTLTIRHPSYTRNKPVIVQNAQTESVTVRVAEKGSVTMRLTDTDGAVANANVVLARDGVGIATGTTDSSGTFETGVIEQGAYTVRFEKPGYYTNRTTVDVTGDIIRRYEMRRGSVTVQFRIVDDHFTPAQPVSDARVEVSDVGSQRTTSGTVTFTVPVNTEHQVTATKDGYTTATTSLSVGESDFQRTLTIQREASLTVSPANQRVVVGETVLVTVTNAYGEPVTGATVLVNGNERASTNSQGEARVTIQQAGDRTIVAEANGVQSAGVTVTGIEVQEDTPTPEPEPTPTATPTAEPESTPTDTEPEEGPAVPLPGFGPLVAIIALLAVALLLGRR